MNPGLEAVEQLGYDILDKISEGGMGAVYTVRHQHLDEIRAVKIIHPHLVADPEQMRRFSNEARAAVRVRHENVASIYDFSSGDDGSAFIVMEYIDGATLQQVLQSFGSPSLGLTLAIATQVLDVLEYLHHQGFVHRDIAPDNLMLTRRFDGDPQIKLIDLGIAKNLDAVDERTVPGSFLGKIRYAAPESFSGGGSSGADPRSDVYSFGVMLYELLTGMYPIAGEDTASIIAGHLYEPIRNFDDADPDGNVPEDLRSIVTRALSKKPEDRPSVRSFAEACRSERGKLGDVDLGDETRRALDAVGVRSGGPVIEPDGGDRTVMGPAPSTDDLRAVLEQAETGGRTGHGESTQFLPGTPVDAEAESISVALTVVRSGDLSRIGKSVPLESFPFTIGRSADADMSIPRDPALSRRHLVIHHDRSVYSVQDLGSSNGSYVNGRRLGRDPEHLLFGDTIWLSSATVLSFVADIPSLPDLTGRLLAGRFRLNRELHSSIKASTYASTDEVLPRSLAIKVFSPTLATLPHYMHDFREQAERAARLSHPHIRKVIDYGETSLDLDGERKPVRYLCTELLEGGDLAARIKDEPKPSFDRVTTWLRGLGEALEFAHGEGVVHGGLKPGCILFDRHDRPFVTDFALASSGDTGDRRPIVGAPAFLAPEQWDGRPATPASDQYAMAALTYLVVTGASPYEGQEYPETRRRNFARGAVPAHEEAADRGRTDVPAAVSAVLEKAMRTEPDRRYASVLAFADAFAEAAAGRAGARQPRIFLSYHRESSSGWARYFEQVLRENHSISTFVDTERRDRAIKFSQKLAHAILDCDVFVCLLGKRTLDSAWVREEIRLAHEGDKPMVPIFQEKFRMPESPDEVPSSVQALLDFDGVHLMDDRNIYVDEAIEELAKLIRIPTRD